MKRNNYGTGLDYDLLEKQASDKTPKAMRKGNFYVNVKRQSNAGIVYKVLQHK